MKGESVRMRWFWPLGHDEYPAPRGGVVSGHRDARPQSVCVQVTGIFKLPFIHVAFHELLYTRFPFSAHYDPVH